MGSYIVIVDGEEYTVNADFIEMKSENAYLALIKTDKNTDEEPDYTCVAFIPIRALIIKAE